MSLTEATPEIAPIVNAVQTDTTIRNNLVDIDPCFEGTVDLDPDVAIMQEVTRRCISAACMDSQEKRAAELAIWAAPGGRTTPKKAASRILDRMGCEIACPKMRSNSSTL